MALAPFTRIRALEVELDHFQRGSDSEIYSQLGSCFAISYLLFPVKFFNCTIMGGMF